MTANEYICWGRGTQGSRVVRVKVAAPSALDALVIVKAWERSLDRGVAVSYSNGDIHRIGREPTDILLVGTPLRKVEP